MADDRSGWARLAAQLATMPDVAARLLAEHVADGHGRCTRCTTGGRGTCSTPWPCGPAALALDAQRIARRAH